MTTTHLDEVQKEALLFHALGVPPASDPHSWRAILSRTTHPRRDSEERRGPALTREQLAKNISQMSPDIRPASASSVDALIATYDEHLMTELPRRYTLFGGYSLERKETPRGPMYSPRYVRWHRLG